MKLSLKPALVEMFDAHQCVVDQVQGLRMMLLLQADSSQKTELTRSVQMNAQRLLSCQTMADLVDARLNRAAIGDCPSMKDGTVRRPCREPVLRGQRHHSLGPLLDRLRLAADLMKPTGQV